MASFFSKLFGGSSSADNKAPVRGEPIAYEGLTLCPPRFLMTVSGVSLV